MQHPNSTQIENPEVDLTLDDFAQSASATSKLVTYGSYGAASTMPDTPEVIDIDTISAPAY